MWKHEKWPTNQNIIPQKVALNIACLLVPHICCNFPTITSVYREWTRKKWLSSSSSMGKKCLIDVRGQWIMRRLIRADRKATVTQIITQYNQAMHQNISRWSNWATGATAVITGNWGYNSHMFIKTGQKKLKNVARSNESWFLLLVMMSHKQQWQHGSILPCINISYCCCWCRGYFPYSECF